MLLAGGYDFSGAAFSVSVSERANGGAAELCFSLPKSMSDKVDNGDEVSFSLDGKTLFHGYVFAVEQRARMTRVTVLDSLRYLAAVMPIERGNETAAAFAERAVKAIGGRVICGAFEDNGILLERKRFGSVTLLKAIYSSIEESVTAGGERLILRDEGGKIALRRESSLALPLIIGEESLATDFSISRSIGENAVNYAKVTAENKKAGMKIAVIARNDESIAKWGMLTRVVSGKGDTEKLLAQAGNILSESCRESEEITVSAKGDASVRAGCSVTLRLPEKSDFSARVQSCVHSLEGKRHIMRLRLERL